MLHKIANNIWYNKSYKLLSWLFLPFSIFWFLLVVIRWILYKFKPITKSQAYVVCVGNLTIGGGGKTPTVMYLANSLQNVGFKALVVKKAYKSSFKQATLLLQNCNSYTAQQIGDEALLINQHCDVIVCNSWSQGFKLANQHSYNVIIMDDGLQNNSVHKDFNLIVVDSQYKFGNKLPLPAGPLRNLFSVSLKKANAFLVLGSPNIKLQNSLNNLTNKPVFSSNFSWVISPSITNYNVLGFCGLAIPNKFLNTLNSLNLNVVKFVTYTDHYAYTTADLIYLTNLAKRQNLQLICTQKDLVKINTAQFSNIAVVKQTIQPADLVLHIANTIKTG